MNSLPESQETESTLEPADIKTTTAAGEEGADVIVEAEPSGEGELHEEVFAETVNISQGGAQTVTADKVYVEQGGIARAEGRFIDVKDGGIGIAKGENVTLTDGGAGIVAAENVRMNDAMAFLVAAKQIEGEDVSIIFDMRAAAVFALILGLVTSLFKLITRRRQ